MESKKITARAAAFRSLIACERDKKYSNLEIDAAIRRFKLDGPERGLYTALTYGVIERRITLDYIIAKLSTRPLAALDAPTATLLRLGLYQLIWLDRVPDHAAVGETVALAKAEAPRAASFVNAVLRGFQRTYGKDDLPLPEKSDPAYLAVKYSVGADVLAALHAASPDTEALLAGFEAQRAVTLRVNTLKLSREALLMQLADAGCEAEACRHSPFGVKLKNGTVTPEIAELIEKGFVYIQDEASQLAVLAASPAPGSTVIDTCACPGGKSFSAAMLMENTGRVMSFDLHKNKLSLVDSGAKKLGITIIETAEKNGAVYDAALDSVADTVLCDVPCSGLGVIAKKPEIRYKSLADFARLPEIQLAIVENCAKYVKKGGILVYSTCTVLPEENEENVAKILANHPEFAPVDFSVGDVKSENGMLTLSPDLHATDGFFVAKFIKK